MIGFFRKIRRNLADNNKPVKYFRYAVGEIVLVVIGILIALSINNWNEERKNRIEEQGILLGLSKEFKANLEELRLKIELNKNVTVATISLINEIRKKNPFQHPKNIDSLLLKIYMYATFTAESGLLVEAISSGKLSYIQNRELQSKLASWQGKLSNSQEEYNYREMHYNNQLLSFLQKNLRISNGDSYMDITIFGKEYQMESIQPSPFTPSYENINLLEFENLLWLHKTDNEFVIMDEIDLHRFTAEIVSLIDEELD